MKTNTPVSKIAILCLILFSNISFAGTFTSKSNGGGPWTGGAVTWTIVGDVDGIPDADDDMFILAGDNITWGTSSGNCRDLTINGTMTGSTAGAVIYLNGNYTISGTGAEVGVGQLGFKGLNKTISSLGSISLAIRWFFFNNTTILSPTVVTKTAMNIAGTYNPIVTVTNQGNVTMTTIVSFTGARWTNDVNSSLTLKANGFMSGAGRIFTASAVGNTVSLQYTTGSVPSTTGSTYYNLRLTGTSAGTKTISSDLIVLNTLTINTNNNFNSNNFNISVGKNWTNSATFTASTGKTVTFNGTTPQLVSNTLGTTTFKQLTINNNSGVTLSTGTYILDEVLTITSGTFNTGGRPFTMTSTAARTARIAPILGSGAIAGNFIIQRFITSRDTTFADLSSPVQSSTFLDWDNELPAIAYNSSPPTQQASAATYDETADAYVPITSPGTSLNPGQGFEVFLSGDFSYGNLPNTTMTTVGVPNQGDFDLSSTVSNTLQGWNLVGNPFASNISWSSVYTASGGAASGMYDYIEMYDYTIGDWNGYTSGSGIEIGATQGFWVYGLAGPMTLKIPESSKTTTSNSSIKAAVISQPYFTLKLGSTSSNAAHIFKVAATDIASDGLDNKDIPYRASLSKATPEMYCIVDGRKININNFNSSNDNYSIPLKTKATVSGSYKIEAAGFDFVDYTCVKLQDNLTGKLIDLTEGNGYCFTMNTTDNEDRFILHFSKDNNCKTQAAAAIIPSVDFTNQVEILPTSQGNVVNFNLSETTNANISIVNVLGQTIVESISLQANTQSVNIALPEGFSGLYIVKIESSKGSITKKFVKK